MNFSTALSPGEQHMVMLRQDFQRQIGPFLEAAGVPSACHVSFAREPVFIVTGANFTSYDSTRHGNEPEHAFYEGPAPREKKYLMNNTAAILKLLMDEGRRVLVHSSAPDIVRSLTALHRHGDQVHVIGGDLSKREALPALYTALEEMQRQKPIDDINLVLYQSFAQSSGDPFKPIYLEKPEELERAASRRLNFIFNMKAMASDFLMRRGLDGLRVVALSALASRRASFGLMADATDKFMNEVGMGTFHIELNNLTGKKVSLYQINPGITAACDVYRRPNVVRTVCQESIADGFPFDDDVLAGDVPLPQLSARDVAWVAHALLTTPMGEDPNRNMPEHIGKLLYGGFTPDEFHARFQRLIQIDNGYVAINPDRVFPEHILGASSQYGALPRTLRPGEHKRVSICPVGQRF